MSLARAMYPWYVSQMAVICDSLGAAVCSQPRPADPRVPTPIQPTLTRSFAPRTLAVRGVQLQRPLRRFLENCGGCYQGYHSTLWFSVHLDVIAVAPILSQCPLVPLALRSFCGGKCYPARRLPYRRGGFAARLHDGHIDQGERLRPRSPLVYINLTGTVFAPESLPSSTRNLQIEHTISYLVRIGTTNADSRPSAQLLSQPQVTSDAAALVLDWQWSIAILPNRERPLSLPYAKPCRGRSQ